MFNDLGCINVLEAPHLPPKTIRAPIHMIREIRLTLGPLPIHLEVGGDEDVYISTDLFSAFAKWSDELAEDTADPSALN